MASTVPAQNLPAPPGSLTTPASPGEFYTYIETLTAWCQAVEARVAAVDDRSVNAAEPDRFAADVALAWALYRSVTEVCDKLVSIFDGGRVDAQVLRRLAETCFARLGRGAAGAGMSLTETAALLVAHLDRVEKVLDSHALTAVGVGDRVGVLRSVLSRLDADVDVLSDVEQSKVVELVAQLDAAVGSATAGADVGTVRGKLDLVQSDVDRFAREVGEALNARLHAVGAQVRAGEEFAAAIERRSAVLAAAELCRVKVVDVPRVAIADPSVLSKPDGFDPAEQVSCAVWVQRAALLAEFRTKLGRVSEALEVAYSAYSAPVVERNALRGLLDSYRAMAAARGFVEDAGCAAAYDAAKAVLYVAPCDVAIAKERVADYQNLVRSKVMTHDLVIRSGALRDGSDTVDATAAGTCSTPACSAMFEKGM